MKLTPAETANVIANLAYVLPFSLKPEGPLIVGGSLVRALLDADSDTADIDIIFANAEQADNAVQALYRDGWKRVVDVENGEPPGSMLTGPAWAGKWQRPFGSASPLTLDLIGDFFTLGQWLGDVDLTVCGVATDGHTLWLSQEALFDLIGHTFHTLRETRRERIGKYMDMGLDPALPDAALARPSVPGWWRADITRAEALKRTGQVCENPIAVALQ